MNFIWASALTFGKLAYRTVAGADYGFSSCNVRVNLPTALQVLGGESGREAVVGAYPPGQQWDIWWNVTAAEAMERMRTLPFPKSGPVDGAAGPLMTLWR